LIGCKTLNLILSWQMPIQNFPIDLNCDLGEGLENDALIMPLLGSCNIACGGHYGNNSSISKTLLLAKQYEVNVGAHPSIPDRVNFGRSWLDISQDYLRDSILTQLQNFHIICNELKIPMHHIKPHGALYNQASKDENISNLILDLIQEFFPKTSLYCPPPSVMLSLAKNRDMDFRIELFADRTYQDDLSLTPRNLPNALLTSEKDVLEQVKNIIYHERITSLTGKSIPVQADTLCIHSDNPNVLNLLKSIEKEFSK
jgi:5-oxoprolinase (ATP-hydrolysing) subunit A